MVERRHDAIQATGAKDGPAVGFSVPVLLVTLITALGAAAVVLALPATVSWGAALVVAGAGGVFSMRLAGGRTDSSNSRAQLLLELADAPAERTLAPRPRLPGAWGALYEKLSALVQEARTGRTAIAELERFRRHAEQAAIAFRDRKDPLAESEDLRTGPLQDLLEAARHRTADGPVVSRIPLGEEELVGIDGEPFPARWPAPSEGAGSAGDPRIRAELRRGLEELLTGLSRLDTTLDAGSGAGAGTPAAMRTPAQLVDAVVHTAADGIEDLAAGLMRANELASVAERVTNRATLLALNAALEATRSGSEAFAAIAEETRRLAEFAREATDTISRLANEIEYKVGETIHAIHQTSDDAKTALAALGSTAPATAAPVPSRADVKALLAKAHELRRALDAAGSDAASASAGRPEDPSEPTVPPPVDAGAPQGEAHDVQADPAEDPSASLASGAYLTIDASLREDLVENDRPSTEKGNAKDFLLLEGLEPGSRFAG